MEGRGGYPSQRRAGIRHEASSSLIVHRGREFLCKSGGGLSARVNSCPFKTAPGTSFSAACEGPLVDCFRPFPQKKTERMGHGTLCGLAQSERRETGASRLKSKGPRKIVKDIPPRLKPASIQLAYRHESTRALSKLPWGRVFPQPVKVSWLIVSHPFRRRKRKGWGTEPCADWRRARGERLGAFGGNGGLLVTCGVGHWQPGSNSLSGICLTDVLRM